MTAHDSGRDQEVEVLRDRLAIAEETLRALLAGEADAIVMNTGEGEHQIYTLETEERPYRHLVERMSEGAALSDADGLIVYANQRLATLLGVPLERLLGRPFSDWLDKSDRDSFIPRLATEAPSGHDEHTLRRLDGSSVPVLVGISVMQEPDRVLRCVTVTDLSQQKEQQRQMDSLNQDLQVANEAIRDFIAVASHDLRSPLVSIVGFSSLLNQSWETFSEQDRRKFVRSIDRQSHNLSRMVDALFTAASLEAGSLNASPELLGLAGAIARCLDEGSGDAVSVAVTCPPDLVVRVDPHHLGRILDNCVQNAFKYGEPPVSIEATRVGDIVEVRVRDHGPGVPPDFVPRLFGKFSRVDNAQAKAQQGTGLGLSIVRGLVEANSGRVRYEPNVPRGSCFVVELPAGDGVSSPSRMSSSPDENPPASS
jgi:PAS domain S-box-containing protein